MMIIIMICHYDLGDYEMTVNERWITFWPDDSGGNSDVLVITEISKLMLPEKYLFDKFLENLNI